MAFSAQTASRISSILHQLQGDIPLSQFSKTSAPEGISDPTELKTIRLFERAKKSVVFVQVFTQAVTTSNLFSSNPVPDERKSAGSGIVWDEKGHIITNAHVVRNVGQIRVVFSDSTESNAHLVGHDAKSDLAILQIEKPTNDGGEKPQIIPLLKGDSSSLAVGQTAFAIGNPFGLHHTMTSGIISGLGREIPAQEGGVLSNLIQTDAPINPGNSGGPLLDSQGRLIGVTTAILSPTGTSNGLGFAVPINTVKDIIGQLLKFGRVVRPQLGILMAPDSIRAQTGLSSGVIIWGVKRGSPAAAAGLVPVTRASRGAVYLGDIILAIDGKEITSGSDLVKEIEQRKIGDTLKLSVLRGSSKEKRTISVTLFEYSEEN